MTDLVREAKACPIESILDRIGCKRGRSGGGKVFFSSPFSSDSTPSLCVFINQNTWFDYSNGYGGDAIDLYRKVKKCSFPDALQELCEGVSLDNIEQFIKGKSHANNVGEGLFLASVFYPKDEEQVKKVDEYARSRRIRREYIPAVISDYSTGTRVDRLAMQFVHVDEELKICGSKFRFIDPDPEGSRFTARGKQRFYILENIIEDYFKEPTLYLVESESSANSLWEVLCEEGISCVVISFGAVSNRVGKLPEKYEHLEKYIIIDYDGNDELYQQRLNLHKDTATPIKVMLDKDEDFNSLYVKNKQNIFKHLIIS